MNLTIQIGVYAEKNEKFNSLPKNVEFSSIQEMATYLDLESAKYKEDPLLLVRLKEGSQPHLIDYKSNYALRNFIKEVAEHYFNLQNHIPMSENNIIGGKISEIAEKVVNGEYEDFKKFDKNTQNIILMYIEKSERSNRLEVLSDVWNSEITHPSALSKGMTVSQIDEKANNYYSSHRSFQNQQNEINMENQKLSFWDKNITPLTNKYKNFIKEMENTPSEIFYRDGEREFSEQEKKFMQIYKYKENKNSNTSETATILNKIENDSSFFQELPEELKQNKNFVYEAVTRNLTTLQFVSDEFKNDKDLLKMAVKQYGKLIQYASAELRNNKEVVLEAVKTDGFALEYVSNELKNDREVVLEAVKSDGFALRFASDELRNDKEIALEAVKQNKHNFEYVSETLKNDKEFVLEAEKQMKQEKIYSVSFRSYNTETLEFSSEKPEVLDLSASELKEVINEKKKSFTNDEELSISVDGLRIDVQWDAKIEEIMAKISNNEKANELITKIQKELTPEEKVFLREKFIEEINPKSTAKNIDNPFYIDNDSKEKVNAFDKEIREISSNYENYIDTIDRVLVKWESNEQLRNETSPVYIEITKRNQNEINQKNIMDEKVESLIGMVANNKEDENVGYKVKLFNELTNEEKSFFKENAKNIAIENIEEIQEGISEEEKQSISQKFDTFFKHIEQDSKKSIEQNEVVNYLKNQLKYLGFGESDELHRKLQDGVQNTKEKDYFQIEVKSDKALQGNEANFSLSFYKSEKGGVYLNSFKGELKDSKGELKTHSFGVNNFTAKEAVNLLEGRAVKTQFTNKNTGEMEDVFVKLKLNEEKNEFGNYKMQVYNKNYGINTKDIVEKSKLIFSGEDAEKIKDLVIKSLEKGNVVNVRFKNDSNQEMNGKAVLNPQYKNINLYDEQMNRVNTNKPIQGLEADKKQEKNNVREQSRVRSHH